MKCKRLKTVKEMKSSKMSAAHEGRPAADLSTNDQGNQFPFDKRARTQLVTAFFKPNRTGIACTGIIVQGHRKLPFDDSLHGVAIGDRID